jgi:sulfur-carrier protein
MLKILYFAWVRERIGIDGEETELPISLTSARDIADWLAARGGGYAAAFADISRVRCAVDQRMVGLDEAIGSAKEIAFFPPVTGG